MQRPPVYFAVIPAAGQSSRMGRPKLSLPLAGRTVLEHVVLTLREGGVPHVLVVTGPHTLELNALAKAAGADVLTIRDETPGMRATTEHGLIWLKERRSPRAHDAFILAPGDHPAFGVPVVVGLREAYIGLHNKSIIVPNHAGKRGHPVLIAWRHAQGIMEMAANCGVNRYLRENSEEIYDFETDDQGILFNLDSPKDLATLNRRNSAFVAWSIACENPR